MQVPKKHVSKKTVNITTEPQANYEINAIEKVTEINTPEQDIFLQKMLDLGLKQIEKGMRFHKNK